jgi:hypothetical protein
MSAIERKGLEPFKKGAAISIFLEVLISGINAERRYIPSNAACLILYAVEQPVSTIPPAMRLKWWSSAPVAPHSII